MATIRMRSATIIGHAPVMDAVVDALQCAGAVEVVASPLELPPPKSGQYADTHAEANLSRARRLVALLDRYHVNEQPMSMFVSEKFHTSLDDYRSLTFHERFESVFRQAVDAEDEIHRIDEESAEFAEVIEEMRPWGQFSLPVERWIDAPSVRSYYGTILRTSVEMLIERISATSPLIDAEVVGAGEAASPNRAAIVVIAHDSVADVAEEVLADFGFEPARVSGLKGSASQVAEGAARQIEAGVQERTAAEDRLRDLARDHYAEVYLLTAALESKKDSFDVRNQFASTRATFAVTGWVPESREADLHAALLPFESDVDLTLEDPREGDDVPVELANHRLLKPFELLTDLYGRPRYGEVDPTPLIAPFFTLFVALCIGDVGYGLMLVLAMYLINTRLDVAEGVRKFTALITYGGLTAVPVGIAFGSYFALPFEYLPAFLQRLRILDPLNEVVTLLGFALTLGAIQVVLGIVVAAWAAFRRGDAESAVGTHLSVLFLLASVAAYVLTGAVYPVILAGGLIITVLLQGKAITLALRPNDRPAWDRALGVGWLLSVLAVTAAFAFDGMLVPALWVLLGMTAVGAGVSSTARRVVLATLGGAWAVYGLTGILNDTLSYTRLAALGLSSTLVGMVFNIMAEMVWSPAAGYFEAGGWGLVLGAVIALLAVTVFAVGHVFNVTVNLLGAFVHPMRLQFVEFFSKFYEAGNRPFQPLAYRQDRIVLSAGEPGEKGGVS